MPFDPPSVPINAAIVDVGAEHVVLSWQRPDKDGGGRVRGYMVEKKESNTEFWQKCTQAPSPSTSLNVNNLIEGRTYDFRIMAVNDAGDSVPALIEKYEFKPASKGDSPEILSPLKDQYGATNGSVTLECEISGTPKPEISWFRGSKELVDTSKCTLIDKGTKQVLIINNLHAEDEDEYTCRATNPLGSKSTRAQLKLSSKPRVFLPPRYNLDPLQSISGGTATWTRNDEPIENGSKYSIVTDEKVATLRISDAQREDSGEYKVVVQNNVGSDSGSVRVNVLDKPEPPRFPNTENVLDEAAILSWKPPNLDGGSFVTGYIVEKREAGSGKWERCAKSRFTYITVEGLKPEQAYEFRISAENKHGVSEPSAATSPVTILSPDQGVPITMVENELPVIVDPNRGILPQNYYFYHCSVDDTGKIVRGRGKAVENYDAYVIDEIGTGAFGVVHRCVEKATGNVFAVKFVTTNNEKDKEMVRKEINTMSELRHPTLINLHDAFEGENEMVMVYEFMSGGELFEKVSDEKNRMSEGKPLNIFTKCARPLVHLDLKPENIMFTTRKSNQLKLIDFGLTTKLDPKEPVKVTTGTAEFAAPEIVLGTNVGFYTDMWSVGVLSYILLSGLSPFGGENDDETLKNVKSCDWNMDDPAFNDISSSAKDFIRKLLVMDANSRMDATAALGHPWLADRFQEETKQIPSNRYFSVRDSIRSRYDAWPEPHPPIGRVAQYSAIKKLRPTEYGIHESSFDKNDALPRFVVRPCGPSRCGEGESASFFCKVLSPTLPIVSWIKDGEELRQSVKYSKNTNNNDYALTINNVKMEDRGPYTVKAENSYGVKEEVFYFDVIRKHTAYESNNFELPPIRKTLTQVDLPRVKEELKKTPFFSFYLRPRLIQKNHACKLICTVTGNPTPTIEWFKDGTAVSQDRVQILCKSGVCTLEIFNMRPEDAGTYMCKAVNELGEDSTECVVSVQSRHGKPFPTPLPPLTSGHPA
uniref:Twitchin n=1 Tax=Ditylenchus dipsaci TaxID=166011 RepID=A0A915DCR3_9BILA